MNKPLSRIALASSLLVSALLTAPRAQFSQVPPGNLKPSQVPMIICLGFDDNARVEGVQWFMDYAAKKRNPAGLGVAGTFDGTPVRATWFLTANYITAEGFVTQGNSGAQDLLTAWKALYQGGHEIANHTWDHPHGASLDLAAWKSQITRSNDHLSSALGVPLKEITGFRTPFLEYSPVTLQALKELGFEYDASIEFGFVGWVPTAGDTGFWNGMTNPETHKKLWWPWTLDAGSPPGHAAKGNPIVPGLWEMPVTSYMKPEGQGEVTGFDFNIWKISDKTQFVSILKQEFDLRRAGNRNPFLLSLHSDYYTQYNEDANKEFTLATWQERQKGMEEFLDYALSFPETRVVPYRDAIAWMKKPVALSGEPGSVHRTVLSRSTRSIRLAPGGILELDIPSAGHYKVTLVDPSGRIAFRVSGRLREGTARFKAGGLRPGVYHLKLDDGRKAITRMAALSH